MCAPLNTELLNIKFPKHMFIMDRSSLGPSGFIYACRISVWAQMQNNEKLSGNQFLTVSLFGLQAPAHLPC